MNCTIISSDGVPRKEGMTMLIVTHEMKFARDISTSIFFMMGGYIHEDGTPEQIFEAPIHSATKTFIQRIRKEVFEIDGPDFDFLGMHSTINTFCQKYNITGKVETAQQLSHCHTAPRNPNDRFGLS